MAKDGEKEKTSKVTEQIIKELDDGDVSKQRNSIVGLFYKFEESIGELELLAQLKYRIKFLQSIKPQVLTLLKGMMKNFNTASVNILNFFEYLKENNINEMIEKLTDDEKSDISIKMDVLLNRLIISLVLQKEQAEDDVKLAKDLENFIGQARDSIVFFVGVIQEREKEENLVGDLETQAGIFEKKANNYKSNSRWFLSGASALILLIALLQISNLFCRSDFCKASSELEYINLEQGDYLYFYVALKTLLSSSTLLSVVMLVGLFACIRFYSASNHNAIICDQRANTLKSYKALRNASEEGEERLLVLQKILDSATVHQATGFSKQEKNDSDNIISRITSDLVRLLKPSN